KCDLQFVSYLCCDYSIRLQEMLFNLYGDAPQDLGHVDKEACLAATSDHDSSLIFKEPRLHPDVLTDRQAIFDCQRDSLFDQLCHLPQLLGQAGLVADRIRMDQAIRSERGDALVVVRP